MSRTIIVDPFTRISGFLEVSTTVDDADTVVDAKVGGLLIRGFEKMLENKSPYDAVYMTERICGICSAAHAHGASMALENILKSKISLYSIYIRDLIQGFDLMQNVIRHFYLFLVPDYVQIEGLSPISDAGFDDFRIPKEKSDKIIQNYERSNLYARLAHEAVALLGGKIPHIHGILPGGVTTEMDEYKLAKLKSILFSVNEFCVYSMQEDLNTIATYYNDYFEKGKSYGNYMSFGYFDDYEDNSITHVKSGVMINGKLQTLNTALITENLDYAYYEGNGIENKNNELNNLVIQTSKEKAYSYIKAPRYMGMAMEVGPLARMMISGEYTRGNSTMDRNTARIKESIKVLKILDKILDKVESGTEKLKVLSVFPDGIGSGFKEAPRGSLAHYLTVKNNNIVKYDIITPSGWNLSPKDDKGVYGVAEKALLGTKLSTKNKALELGRIVRSFDPCVSCATH